MVGTNHLDNFVKEIGFLAIWAVTLLTVELYGLVSAYRSTSRTGKSAPDSTQNEQISPSKVPTLNLILQIGFLALFVGIYVHLILDGIDFAGGDNSLLTIYSVRGNPHPMPIWGAMGRFFPFGHQEFNIISAVSNSPLSYHLFAVAQLLVTLALSFFILREFSITHRILTILLILIVPSFSKVFFGLIFPERNVIFWLTIFIAAIQLFSLSKPRWCFCIALIAAQTALYYKEPVFLFVSGFAGSCLLQNFQLTYLSEGGSFQWQKLLRFAKTQWLDVALIVLSFVYLLLYTIVTVPNLDTVYTADRANNRTELSALVEYLQLDPFLSIFILVFLARIVYLLKTQKSINTIWDSLAIGTLLYFLAYVKLKLVGLYYMAPVDFLAIMYMSWLIGKLLLNSAAKQLSVFSIAILLSLLAAQSLNVSSYQILQKKKFVESQTQVANFLKEEISFSSSHSSSSLSEVHLFFPVTAGYEVMELSAFLDYKGLKLAPRNYHRSIDESSSSTLVMKMPEKLDNDLCVPYRPYKCYYSSHPQPNNLILFLPNYDGEVPMDDVERFRSSKITLFHYQPRFSASDKILYFLAGANKFLDGWMNVYVFKS